MAEGFIRTASDYPSYRVVGERIAVAASAADTGGLELFHQKGEAGQGPPPHAHPWDETFFVVKGEVEIGVGDRTVLCGPGAVAHAPAGTYHWFRFTSDCEMVSVTSGAGAADFFADVDRTTEGSADMEILLPVALRHGLQVPEPPASPDAMIEILPANLA
ncbi:MAG TPA: cupin domain-containing protein [Allosphingosinicella sp.]|jgi:quercetin dioxygenase-like cupin family protein|nr:cupin domain-containing protein [Allosphingosinicella sp.]